MVAGLTHDVNREAAKHLYESAAEIAEGTRINVSQFISPLQPCGNSFN